MREFISLSNDAMNEYNYPSKLLSILWILLTIIAGIYAFINIITPFRALLFLFFMSFCPGFPWIRLLNLNNYIIEIILSIALSLSLASALATIMVYNRLWYPKVALGILIFISFAGTAAQLYRTRRALSTAR